MIVLTPLNLYFFCLLFLTIPGSLILLISPIYLHLNSVITRLLTNNTFLLLTIIGITSLFVVLLFMLSLLSLFSIQISSFLSTVQNSLLPLSFVCLIWLIQAFIMAFFFYQTQKGFPLLSQRYISHHISRKVYHLIAFICFACPCIMYHSSSVITLFTALALSVSMSAFLLVDIFIYSSLKIKRSYQPENNSETTSLTLYKIANSLSKSLSVLLDSRDNPSFPTSHISLLFGCSLPYLFTSEVLFQNSQPPISEFIPKLHHLFPSSNPSLLPLPPLSNANDSLSFCTLPSAYSNCLLLVLQLSGAISVGIGDAFAAIAGRSLADCTSSVSPQRTTSPTSSAQSLHHSSHPHRLSSPEKRAAVTFRQRFPFSVHHWPRSHRTLEGSCAMALSMQSVIFLVVLLSLTRSSHSSSFASLLCFAFYFTWASPPMWCSILVTVLSEAYCVLNDNVILPVIFFISLYIFHFIWQE